MVKLTHFRITKIKKQSNVKIKLNSRIKIVISLGTKIYFIQNSTNISTTYWTQVQSFQSKLLIILGFVYPETSYCPQPDIQKWYGSMSCPLSNEQINNDLSLFKEVDLEKAAAETIQRYKTSCLCHYKIIDNKVSF